MYAAKPYIFHLVKIAPTEKKYNPRMKAVRNQKKLILFVVNNAITGIEAEINQAPNNNQLFQF